LNLKGFNQHNKAIYSSGAYLASLPEQKPASTLTVTHQNHQDIESKGACHVIILDCNFQRLTLIKASIVNILISSRHFSSIL
jgi:hypothetical protein